MAIVLRRTALFVTFVLLWALVAAAVAHASTRQVVVFEGYPPGTIVVKTHERRLYYVLDGYHALRFPVGVGRAGMQWTGLAHVEGKYVRPAWEAPPSIRRENPRLPRVIPGGAPNNPMGAAALTLRGGEYAIHGTNRPSSIGRFVSHGCIRMYNSDIVQLYRMVPVGTPVIVER
jgi:lipoprotein-anchoring transpeptidase ErfK/SrfK